MRYLKPSGWPIEINKKKYFILYTLNIIDELQDKTEMSIAHLMECLTSKNKCEKTVRCLLIYLIGEWINNEIDQELSEGNRIEKFGMYSIVLLGSYIDQLKSKDTRVKKVGAFKSESSYQRIDIERWFYIGKTVLGYSEEEVWNMTLGKLITLHNEHLIYNGQIEEEKEVSLLSI